MKILFIGDIQGGFIEQDYKILSERHTVDVINMHKYPLSIKGGISFLKRCLTISPSDFDLAWVWFADVHAVPLIILAKLKGKPVIVCTGDYEVNKVPELNYGNQLSKIRGFISRWVLRNATVVIAASPPFVHRILEVEPNARNVVSIPCCIDTTPCRDPIPQKKNIVITSTVSEFSKTRKGVDIFERIIRNYPDLNMISIFNVKRSEYIRMLKDAKVYCQLSHPRCESFGVSVAEAMSYGCVPVISNNECLEWVVDGTGVVSEYGDVNDIVSAIRAALTCDGVNAQKRASAFSIETRKRKIEELLLHHTK